jgi:hypothetical protein
MTHSCAPLGLSVLTNIYLGTQEPIAKEVPLNRGKVVLPEITGSLSSLSLETTSRLGRRIEYAGKD